MLCPKRHGLALSDDTGLLSFYSRVETTYHNGYADPLENLSCGAANLLMKTGAMETSFGGPKPHSPWPTDPSENPATTFCLYRSSIPWYPFRLLAPSHQARLASTLGCSLDYTNAGIIPPDTDFRVLLCHDLGPRYHDAAPRSSGGSLGLRRQQKADASGNTSLVSFQCPGLQHEAEEILRGDLGGLELYLPPLS